MSIQIVCPHCGAKGNAPDSIAGQQVRCSKCKNAFVAQTPGGGAPATFQSQPQSNPAGSFSFEEGPAPIPVEDGPGPIAQVSRSRSGSEGGFGSFLMFRSFAGRYLVVVYFWLMIAVVLFMAGSLFLTSIAAFRFSPVAGVIVVAQGLATLILGPMMVRLFCELMAILFRINERLADVAELLKKERK